MQFLDISAAVSKGDVKECESAFRALVEYPHEEEITGLSTAAEATATLEEVCRALANDGSVIPHGTIDAINAIAHVEDKLPHGSSYGQGQRVVLDWLGEWELRFKDHIGETGNDASQ